MRMFTTCLVLLLTAGVWAAAVADEKAGPAEKFTYRVTGLFAPDREADLRAALTELTEVTLVSINFADAELTVAFDPKKLFPDAKPDQVRDRFSDKLRTLTHNTFSVEPRRTTPRDQLEQVVIPVAGLDCKACCLAAYESVAKIDGVEQATVSFKEGRITALIDPKKTERAKLEEALKKREVKVLKP